MKVKELEKFAHSAWSPLSYCRTYLALITAEDSREPTVSNMNESITTPTLDIFEFNIKESSLSMQANISLQIKQKATCLLWTAPINSGHLDIGLLISGSVSGSLYLYDSQKIISLYQNVLSAQMSENVDGMGNNCMNSVKQSPVICITEQNISNYLYSSRESVHNGVVRSLDFNRFQTNLFASASNDDEIFIWDVEKMEQPMLPDTKIQPSENLNQVAWNPRVQHILCSTSVSRCVIWDLRKSGPVLQLTKTMCQLEPQMMAWSPDVATRLCLADPNNPNADVQLWDLRYPKHMLSLLSHWPPNTTNSPLTGCSLGNAGTVNSLCWGIPECQKSMHKSHYYDKDMVVMTVGASGALPTINGNCGTKLNPTYAEMLVVWSVDQALNSPPDSVTASQEATPEPIFVGRLEGLDDQELANPLCFNTLPTNASVHWIPNHPSLVCVTQSDGWITVYNLMGGINKLGERLNIERYAKQRALAQNSQSLRNSHKVAEAFDDEQPLINFSNEHNNNNISPISSLRSDSLYPVLMGEGNGNIIDNSQLNFGTTDQSTSLSLPQPMPLLRVAPSWLKKPCGVHFAFGGRLVTFSSLISFQSNRTRTNSSMSSSAASDAHHQHQLDSTEVHSNCVVIKWIDVFQLEPSSLEQSDKDRWENSLQDTIECLISVLNCSNDYLKTACKNAKALFKTMVDDEDKCRLQTYSHLDLWNIVQARLDDPPSVKSSLSRLLGYSKQDYKCFNESPSQLLMVLKNALVINDVKTVIQLCLHPNFSSLSLPNLSTLSVFAVLLTNLNRSEQGDLYEEVQSKLFHTLNDISLMQPAINDPVFKSVMMLLNCVLLRTNWITVVQNWPLSDWKTILSAFVNHLWNQDVDLLRMLCSVFTKRLLDTTNSNINIDGDNNRITSSEAELAACICCIVGDDLDGLTKCWLRLNNLNENQLDNVTKCLPLAMLLLFLHRLSSSDHIQCTNISSRLLMNLAIWLAETRSGEQNESVILLALNLLTKTLSTVELYSQTMNNLIDLRHRLWCNLTEEQQQVLSAELRQHFLCPYPHIQCRCGLSNTNSVVEMRPPLFNKSTQQHMDVLQQQQQQQQPHLLSAQNSTPSNAPLQQPTSFYSSIPSNVAVRNTTMNHHQPQNYPPLPFQSVQSPYVATSQNSFYGQHGSSDFSYSVTPPPLFVSNNVGVQSNTSGQNKPMFNISSNIPSPSNNPLSSVTPGVPFSSTSSIVYSPPDLSFADTIKQSNVSSARQMPSVVPPPLPNSCNYPSINHFVQPPNSNPLGSESAFGNK
ncbi:Protein transport protein isoform 1 [Schistosoma japonicum]|uniref:Protein transport protein isoform 1 n=1 Tax=Schistosoma japonicum TaxID=6182 RepID=A0A4Z2DF52_SCHJA|nr:Protein transport protein isoform 1 [Schistosoma japonicum]